MPAVLADPTVYLNDEPLNLVPNSLTYTEGGGEQNVRAASAGGGTTEQIYSENVETNFSMIKFELYPVPADIELARRAKKNQNLNVIAVIGTTPDGATLRRTFRRASLPSDYEIPIGSDTTIELEFKSEPAV